MVQILIFQNDKGIIQDVDNLQNLYKKCNFKKLDGFDEISRCNYEGFEFILKGKSKGKSNKKYIIQLPTLEIAVYGNYSIECKKNNEYINITLDLWNNYLQDKKIKYKEENSNIEQLPGIETSNLDLSTNLEKIIGEEEVEVDGSYIEDKEEKDDKLDKDEKDDEENYDSEEEIDDEDNMTEQDNFEDKDEFDLIDINYLKEEELQKEMYIYSSEEENE